MVLSHESLMDIPTICFGFTMGFMVLTGSKVGKQSLSIYKRTRSIFSLYLWMIWIELIVCLAWAITAWLYLRGDIPPRYAIPCSSSVCTSYKAFESRLNQHHRILDSQSSRPTSLTLFFVIATLWTIQTQCLLQIIANRVALIMTNKAQARMLKLTLLIVVALINISVYCVWIPARLEVSPTFVHLNEVWDRIEKVLYLLIDLGLNCYFLWLVRSRLISRGLTKYTPLFRFNAGIVVISIMMDALIIGMMSLPNDMMLVSRCTEI
jgi:hypothetical protein